MDGIWITLLWILATNHVMHRVSATHAQYANTKGYYARMKESGYYSARSPYRFGYHFRDDHGNLQTREENTDSSGARRGSYSFYDAKGIYRRVDYIADSLGFRATVTTNEPGTHHASPADVEIRKEDTKATGIYGGNPRLRIGQTLSQLGKIKQELGLRAAQNKKRPVHYRSKYPAAPTTQWNGPTVLKTPSLYTVNNPPSQTIRTSYPKNSEYITVPDSPPVKSSSYSSTYPDTSPLGPLNTDYSINQGDYYKNYKAPLDVPVTYGTRYKSKGHTERPKTSAYPGSGLRWPAAKQQVKYGKRANAIVEIHVPLGVEDSPYIPIYRDK